MSELKTDNAMTGATSYILGPERRSDGAQVELNHQAGTVGIGLDRTEHVTLSAAEALGLLDVLLHEKPLLVEWAGKDAEP